MDDLWYLSSAIPVFVAQFSTYTGLTLQTWLGFLSPCWYILYAHMQWALDYIPCWRAALRPPCSHQRGLEALRCGAAQIEGSKWIVWPTLNDEEDTSAPVWHSVVEKTSRSFHSFAINKETNSYSWLLRMRFSMEQHYDHVDYRFIYEAYLQYIIVGGHMVHIVRLFLEMDASIDEH